MKKILSGLLAAVSLFGFCAFGSVSKAEETPEQSTQETAKEVKDTELIFIIDKSGSMYSLASDTIGNFNSVIEEQKKNKNGKVYVTTVLFDHNHSKLHDRIDIEEIKEMTDKDYRPSDSTALLDAVGDTLNSVLKIDGIKDRNVVVAIITDGYENASKEYSKEQVKDLIESSEKDGWKILFFGAGVDAFSDKAGAGLGISKDRLFTVGHSQAGVKDMFGCICNEVTATRMGN